jgi:hypothetical protein
MSAPILSVVVPCMGRLHHLKLTAPALLSQPEIEYILVDYSCPDRCGDYARRHWPRAKIVEVSGEKYFNLSQARNAGARQTTAPWLAILDADNVVSPDFARRALALLSDERIMLRSEINSGPLVCHRTPFQRVGGYDERFEGWGAAASDLTRRLLLAGLRQLRLPSDILGVLEHTGAERVRHYRQKDMQVSDVANKRRNPFRLDRNLCRPWPDPTILGISAHHFGDVWKSVQYACYLQRVHQVRVQLYAQWHGWGNPKRFSETPICDRSALAREILAALDAPTELEIVDDAPFDQVIPIGFPAVWHFPFLPTRTRWRGWQRGLHHRIAYQLDGSWSGSRKNPPTGDIPRLLTLAPGFEMVPLGKHLSVQECIETAAHSDLFIGVDSGMAQLCYAVGVAVFLIGFNMDADVLFSFHGAQHPIWCADTDDCLFRARAFLSRMSSGADGSDRAP